MGNGVGPTVIVSLSSSSRRHKGTAYHRRHHQAAAISTREANLGSARSAGSGSGDEGGDKEMMRKRIPNPGRCVLSLLHFITCALDRQQTLMFYMPLVWSLQGQTRVCANTITTHLWLWLVLLGEVEDKVEGDETVAGMGTSPGCFFTVWSLEAARCCRSLIRTVGMRNSSRKKKPEIADNLFLV